MTSITDLTNVPAGVPHASSDSARHYNSDSYVDINTSSIPATRGVDARRQLLDAVRTVSAERLRSVVAKMVQTMPAAEQALMRELITVCRQPHEVDHSWETCANCGDNFDLGTRRREGECEFHSGRLQVDYEMFVDFEADGGSPMNTKTNRGEYPENFKWTCCRRDGSSEGCESTTHAIRARPSKA
ncbi:hypothetical protein EW146_g1880 [Bondarzewia mesenterica]|uniref:C2H2-type domain-containing protein n=1 Tax=Bondarzewia mesenterica TaxID=1095465 RepID=A0A4S4M4A2_9AGAM|nr:hypothetical protein EW146_g1880 [Bondarzewia mesenterica]